MPLCPSPRAPDSCGSPTMCLITARLSDAPVSAAPPAATHLQNMIKGYVRMHCVASLAVWRAVELPFFGVVGAGSTIFSLLHLTPPFHVRGAHETRHCAAQPLRAPQGDGHAPEPGCGGGPAPSKRGTSCCRCTIWAHNNNSNDSGNSGSSSSSRKVRQRRGFRCCSCSCSWWRRYRRWRRWVVV